MDPSPPLTALECLPGQLAQSGWAVLGRAAVCQWAGIDEAAWLAWPPLWDDLPPDTHLRDGGRYRRRRHGCLVVEQDHVTAMPHRAHWQPVAYNALHGGFERWFEPLAEGLTASRAWLPLLRALARVADGLRGRQTWFVEAHPFRIDTQGGIGRPTPEGAHRDGVDLVAVMLIARHNVKGGETRVFEADGPKGVRFELEQPFSVLLLDDERVIHETTPIQPRAADQTAWRDTLVLTYRRGGFQGPEEGLHP